MNHPWHSLSTVSGNSLRKTKFLTSTKLFSGNRMTLPETQGSLYSSWFREVWRPTPMTPEVNEAFKTKADKFKGEEKKTGTFRRKGNLDCDSRQMLYVFIVGKSTRATLSLKRSIVWRCTLHDKSMQLTWDPEPPENAPTGQQMSKRYCIHTHDFASTHISICLLHCHFF